MPYGDNGGEMKDVDLGGGNLSAEVWIAYKESHDSGNESQATLTLPYGLSVQIKSGSDQPVGPDEIRARECLVPWALTQLSAQRNGSSLGMVTREVYG